MHPYLAEWRWRRGWARSRARAGRWPRTGSQRVVATCVAGLAWAVVVACLCGAALLRHEDQQLRQHGRTTTATVTAVRHDGDSYSVTATFTTSSGRIVHLDGPDGYDGTDEVGVRFAVTYDPADPSDASTSAEVASDADAVGLLLIAAVCLPLGAWQTVRAAHRPRPGPLTARAWPASRA